MGGMMVRKSIYTSYGRIDMTIKEIRERYNLTQEKLSELTGIPKRTIENWESGNRKPADYIPGLIQARLEQLIQI